MTRTEISPAFDPALQPIGYALASELLGDGMTIEVPPAPAVPVAHSAPPDLLYPAPDQPADAQHLARSGAVPAASARAAGTSAALADAPLGPGSVRARSDGSSPDPAYLVKGKTATKAFYTPAGAYYTRTRADVWFRTADDARAAGLTERAPRRHR
jgi:hypothetical protein